MQRREISDRCQRNAEFSVNSLLWCELLPTGVRKKMQVSTFKSRPQSRLSSGTNFPTGARKTQTSAFTFQSRRPLCRKSDAKNFFRQVPGRRRRSAFITTKQRRKLPDRCQEEANFSTSFPESTTIMLQRVCRELPTSAKRRRPKSSSRVGFTTKQWRRLPDRCQEDANFSTSFPESTTIMLQRVCRELPTSAKRRRPERRSDFSLPPSRSSVEQNLGSSGSGVVYV